MSIKRAVVLTALVASTALAGCQSTRQALGLTKVVPDEFRVVTKAPLVVPPDYSLRPPAPGEPRPQELQPESAARLALLGEREGENRDDAEKALVAKAGSDKADPLIRYVVDDEFGDIAHKDKSFADRVMFWKSDKPAAQQETPAPVDAAAEQERVAKLTGDKAVVIQRDENRHLKLPGL